MNFEKKNDFFKFFFHSTQFVVLKSKFCISESPMAAFDSFVAHH